MKNKMKSMKSFDLIPEEYEHILQARKIVRDAIEQCIKYVMAGGKHLQYLCLKIDGYIVVFG